MKHTQGARDNSSSCGGHGKHLNKFTKIKKKKMKHTQGARDSSSSCGSHGKHLNKFIKIK